jgi:hypothetical protein
MEHQVLHQEDILLVEVVEVTQVMVAMEDPEAEALDQIQEELLEEQELLTLAEAVVEVEMVQQVDKVDQEL